MCNPALPVTPAKGLQGFTIHSYLFVNRERIHQINYSITNFHQPFRIPTGQLPVSRAEFVIVRIGRITDPGAVDNAINKRSVLHIPTSEKFAAEALR